MQFFSLFFLLFFISSYAVADRPLANWTSKHQANAQNKVTGFTLPHGVKFIQNVSYGKHTKHKMDIYLPKDTKNAPVIFMVHGGAWFMGDKTGYGVVKNKVKHWVNKGFILISVNYRLLPDARPLKQAKDIAKALAVAQKTAHQWGGDASKFIVMGHSAGAHLVSLLATSPLLVRNNGGKPWLGTVSIDTAGYDIGKIMKEKHFPFYDKAFGNSPLYWQRTSPYHQLKKAGYPFLAICSARRGNSCDQATRFVKKAKSFGMTSLVLPVNLAHIATNKQLGKHNKYTTTVDNFLATLHPLIKRLLQKP